DAARDLDDHDADAFIAKPLYLATAFEDDVGLLGLVFIAEAVPDLRLDACKVEVACKGQGAAVGGVAIDGRGVGDGAAGDEVRVAELFVGLDRLQFQANPLLLAGGDALPALPARLEIPVAVHLGGLLAARFALDGHGPGLLVGLLVPVPRARGLPGKPRRRRRLVVWPGARQPSDRHNPMRRFSRCVSRRAKKLRWQS